MRIIVSDTSCMVDLWKAALLEFALSLPYRFVMPNTLFEDEWLAISECDKRVLRDRGLDVRELPGASVARAAAYFNTYKQLHLNDCFALVLAEETEDSILLTGDRSLRAVAESTGIEVHGVLWVIDALTSHGGVPPRRLYEALRLFRDDELVFLPEDEVRKRMRKLARIW